MTTKVSTISTVSFSSPISQSLFVAEEIPPLATYNSVTDVAAICMDTTLPLKPTAGAVAPVVSNSSTIIQTNVTLIYKLQTKLKSLGNLKLKLKRLKKRQNESY